MFLYNIKLHNIKLYNIEIYNIEIYNIEIYNILRYNIKTYYILRYRDLAGETLKIFLFRKEKNSGETKLEILDFPIQKREEISRNYAFQKEKIFSVTFHYNVIVDKVTTFCYNTLSVG